jgi:hypothetical protein
MRWSTIQCNNTLQQSNCLLGQSVTATQHGFQQQSERHDATSLLWVSKHHQKGSVTNCKCPGSAHTPDNMESV